MDAQEGTDSSSSLSAEAGGGNTDSADQEASEHTVGGVPPGVDFEISEPLGSGQAVCTMSPGNGCECEEDAGALYVRCDVP